MEPVTSKTSNQSRHFQRIPHISSNISLPKTNDGNGKSSFSIGNTFSFMVDFLASHASFPGVSTNF